MPRSQLGIDFPAALGAGGRARSGLVRAVLGARLCLLWRLLTVLVRPSSLHSCATFQALRSILCNLCFQRSSHSRAPQLWVPFLSLTRLPSCSRIGCDRCWHCPGPLHYVHRQSVRNYLSPSGVDVCTTTCVCHDRGGCRATGFAGPLRERLTGAAPHDHPADSRHRGRLSQHCPFMGVLGRPRCQ